MKNKINFKDGFTLAETLITIMIIGIMVALMLRTINRVNPDKDKLLFLKTYHAIETVVANVINDPTKYNPTYLTDEERNSGEYDLHHDFRDAPYTEATVNIISNGSSQEKSGLKQSNALCYFMADELNTVGSVNCENGGGISVGGSNVSGANFRLSNGVCLANWNKNSSGTYTGIIDPNCEGMSNGYAVKVFHDGKMTVPETDSTVGENQKKAYEWMQKQTDLK